MPVLLFLIDTSASMNQRTHLGTTYLDIAKGAVETFMKLRGRDPASRGDRYMLVNFEDVPFGIKAGWKESHATFMTELRNLQATGLTSIGQSLRTAFDLLNLNRLVTGIDNYGQMPPLPPPIPSLTSINHQYTVTPHTHDTNMTVTRQERLSSPY
ncbi:integrator complex subunit 6 isoform X2 [Acanthopagrus latus]|uniref:integrator complex subunit 6 isoform X2 n=1 Tax=Acanthopagrus latus TaxID=8177 RepID=UPI00187C3C3F|nr:integrator complex subunit 6 isoform X2 [Acanthopagrus latus]